MSLWKGVLAPLLALLCVAAAAQAPQPPEVAARSYLLMDVSASQVLAAREIDAPVEPASLTKLMSAYLVFDALRAKKLDPKQALLVTERVSRVQGSRMFITPGTEVPVEELVKGMVVLSGNDATMLLAEAVGGTVEHFVELMNQQARALGMKSTTFKNPEGLPAPGHVTTARDLATLASRLLRDFPEEMKYFALRKYRYEGAPAANDSNRNTLLLRDPTVDGLGVGYSEAAGYGVVATARRDFPNLRGRRLLAVVLGAGSDAVRAAEAQKLLNWGYMAYEGVKLFDANQPVAEPPVWKGSSRTVKLGQTRPVVVALPAGSRARLRTQLARPDPLVAPIGKGQQVGTLKVSAGDQLIAEVPMVALDTVEQAGVISRAWDAMRLWIK